MLAEDAPLEVAGKDHPWVSRGGVKLDHGLDAFRLRRDRRGGARRRQLDRRLHRRAAQPRRGQGLCGRCRDQPAGVEAAAGPAGGRPRADQRAQPRRRASSPSRSTSSCATRASSALAKVLEARARPGQAGRASWSRWSSRSSRPGARKSARAGWCGTPTVHERVCDEAAAWVESQGWTVLGVDRKPDHRARRQCGIPAGSDQGWLRRLRGATGGRSRWSRCPRSCLLGSASGWLSQLGLRQSTWFDALEKPTLHAAGLGVRRGLADRSTRCWAWRWR